MNYGDFNRGTRVRATIAKLSELHAAARHMYAVRPESCLACLQLQIPTWGSDRISPVHARLVGLCTWQGASARRSPGPSRRKAPGNRTSPKAGWAPQVAQYCPATAAERCAAASAGRCTRSDLVLEAIMESLFCGIRGRPSTLLGRPFRGRRLWGNTRVGSNRSERAAWSITSGLVAGPAPRNTVL